jgi:uncharacterized protein GlcG (DUF336 family)
MISWMHTIHWIDDHGGRPGLSFAALIFLEEFAMSLSLIQANRIIEAALAHSTASGYKPMAVVVLDEAGHMKATQREDGASMFRMDIAGGKAWASVAMGASSRVLTQRAKDLPAFFGALSNTANGKFIPQTGAVLIKDADGHVLGAVGASGGTGDEDEAICVAGVSAAGLVAG